MLTWLRCSIAAGCVVSVLGILGIQTGAQSSRPLTDARVDGIFKAWSTATPGCAIGVAVKGEPIVRAAYGMADLEHDVPITPSSVFYVGSLSKQFTAFAVALAASAAIPAVFRPVRRDGMLLIDGGIYNPVPFDLIEDDADLTIAIDVVGAPSDGGRRRPSGSRSSTATCASATCCTTRVG